MLSLNDLTNLLSLPIFNRPEPEPEVEYVAAGDDVAVICSTFPEIVVKGFVLRWSDYAEWALIHIWYWDEWADEYRQLYTWEPSEHFRRLDCYLAEGRELQTAIIYRQVEAAIA